MRITPEGEITLDTHGYHNVSYLVISRANCSIILRFYCLLSERFFSSFFSAFHAFFYRRPILHR